MEYLLCELESSTALPTIPEEVIEEVDMKSASCCSDPVDPEDAVTTEPVCAHALVPEAVLPTMVVDNAMQHDNAMPIDYSKFDHIVDSDDEVLTSAKMPPTTVQKPIANEESDIAVIYEHQFRKALQNNNFEDLLELFHLEEQHCLLSSASSL